MKLIKIKEDHYVVVDDSEIKEGEFVYDTITNTIWTWEKYTEDEIDSKYSGKVFKITHSTQPFEYDEDNTYTYDKVKYIPPSYIQELIGEVDVKEESSNFNERHWQKYWENTLKKESCATNGKRDVYIAGYNQAIEDNKEKKYTEEDMRVAIRLATTSKYDHILEFYSEEEILKSLQPKTSWELEIIDGKLKLK